MLALWHSRQALEISALKLREMSLARVGAATAQVRLVLHVE